ncbi:MAG TPA: phosphoribosylamine--glycine ligase [Spirochaetia bacterium]|nr:phosphoribosylamine--glycine ligase [Spirochaetia bacterium]
MKVLILGQGAREHAIARQFSKSTLIRGLAAAGGNAGIADLGRIHPAVSPENAAAVIALVRETKSDLVFVGPEAPAAAGTVDALKKAGIPVIGPDKNAARLESSKVFSKEFMTRHHIPTAEAVSFTEAAAFSAHIKAQAGKKLVVKKSGLAAGKGVLESADQEELLSFGNNILSSDAVLVEEFLEGWEVSIFALGDGAHYRLLAPCTDYKKAHDNDRGPNTGGMGSVSPVPWVDDALMARIETEVVAPTFRGLAADGIFYTGVVYFGLMITAQGPKLLEYNVRFGDPEAQVLLPRITTDFGKIAIAMTESRLDKLPIDISPRAAAGVVVAADGYPGSYQKKLPVAPIEAPPEEEALIFHASTLLDPDGDKVLTNGGRCFTVVGFGENLEEAARTAYRYVDRVRFSGARHRTDIGRKFFSS